MKKIAVMYIIFLCLALASCGQLIPVKIGDILGNPREYAGKNVTVSGQVTEVFSLIAFKYFMLRDNTGEITVVTSRTLPAVGQKLTVRGTVKEAFAIGNQSLIVIEEQPETNRAR